MRRTTIWTATAGRDEGKVFLVREKSAVDAEWWAARAFLALARNGVEVPEEVSNMGLAGMAQLGLKSLAMLRPEDAKPLLDEMLACVSLVPSAANVDRGTGLPFARPLVGEDIEEVTTIVQLRLEVFALHVNFSLPDALSKLKPGASTSQASSTTPTSPQP